MLGVDSFSYILDSFKSFRGPLLLKPVTSQELLFTVSYSKPALVNVRCFSIQNSRSSRSRIHLLFYNATRIFEECKEESYMTSEFLSRILHTSLQEFLCRLHKILEVERTTKWQLRTSKFLLSINETIFVSHKG